MTLKTCPCCDGERFLRCTPDRNMPCPVCGMSGCVMTDGKQIFVERRAQKGLDNIIEDMNL